MDSRCGEEMREPAGSAIEKSTPTADATTHIPTSPTPQSDIQEQKSTKDSEGRTRCPCGLQGISFMGLLVGVAVCIYATIPVIAYFHDIEIVISPLYILRRILGQQVLFVGSKTSFWNLGFVILGLWAFVVQGLQERGLVLLCGFLKIHGSEKDKKEALREDFQRGNGSQREAEFKAKNTSTSGPTNTRGAKYDIFKEGFMSKVMATFVEMTQQVREAAASSFMFVKDSGVEDLSSTGKPKRKNARRGRRGGSKHHKRGEDEITVTRGKKSISFVLKDSVVSSDADMNEMIEELSTMQAILDEPNRIIPNATAGNDTKLAADLVPETQKPDELLEMR